jgi:hypothetical protein
MVDKYFECPRCGEIVMEVFVVQVSPKGWKKVFSGTLLEVFFGDSYRACRCCKHLTDKDIKNFEVANV